MTFKQARQAKNEILDICKKYQTVPVSTEQSEGQKVKKLTIVVELEVEG